MAVALPTTYLNTLYYMQGFDGHGPLVRIIIGCVKGVRAPGIVFAVCIAGKRKTGERRAEKTSF